MSFAKLLVKKRPRFVEADQLNQIIKLCIECVKKPNWEIHGKGKHMIQKCIEEFSYEKVHQFFPKSESKILRGAKKEFNREEKKKNENNSNSKSNNNEVEFDHGSNENVLDLMDPSQVISKVQKIQDDQEPDENLEFDERGRIVMKEATKTKKTNVSNLNEVVDDDDDFGNEVTDLMKKRRQKRLAEKQRQTEESFISETGNKFRASKGKGDVMKKGDQTPYAFAPLSSKTVNKRYRGQMRSAYKKLFKQ